MYASMRRMVKDADNLNVNSTVQRICELCALGTIRVSMTVRCDVRKYS